MEMQVYIPAVAAFEGGRYLPFKGQTAPLAKGRFDKAHLGAAGAAHKRFRRGSALLAAQLADLRVNKAQSGIEPTLDRMRQGSHGVRPALLLPQSALPSNSKIQEFQR